MAKVITLSLKFPATHPKKGQPTYFVEKALNSLNICMTEKEVWLICANEEMLFSNKFSTELLATFYHSLFSIEEGKKHHTIRSGKRWKTGDVASLRVWSGKPYNSKQIVIAPDVKLTVKDIEIDEDGCIWIDGNYFVHPEILADNDGLTEDDLSKWFSKVPFSGQILIWSTVALPY